MLERITGWFFDFLNYLAGLLPEAQPLDWGKFSDFWAQCEGANKVLPISALLGCLTMYFAFCVIWAPVKMILARMGLR